MGDRGQVFIEDTGVYLYTHWQASELVENVKIALKKKWRWDDPEYLARIIFDTMTVGQHNQETDFGIGTHKHDDIWLLITVNCEKQAITIDDYTKGGGTVSFEKFIQ